MNGRKNNYICVNEIQVPHISKWIMTNRKIHEILESGYYSLGGLSNSRGKLKEN